MRPSPSIQPWSSQHLQKWATLCIVFFTAILVALAFSQIWQETPVPISTPATMAEPVVEIDEPIQPIPLSLDLDDRVVALGDRLFHDPLLSSDYTLSCASCHGLDTGGTDRLVVSRGINGNLLATNSPTVFNIGFHSRQSWDGRADTLEDQMGGPLQSVTTMGGLTWSQVIERIEQDPDYIQAFREVYQTRQITEAQVKDAIATFERSLYTPNAPFDQYLRGDKTAISEDAKQGYALFKSYGCVTCHQGVAIGGNMFQTLGIFGDYFADRGTPITKADWGRYNVTGNNLDRHVFKVPSLRNIVLTSPYFHDGNVATLNTAIRLMGQYQLGVDIPDQDVDLLLTFLQSLTGEYQGNPL
ncbi:MAG: cytochrome c peroxidase [Leptolyngbyaceae bacterium]|nr:cytochrome c peroxidase [Leptolyngbyaceae bacterium]